MRVLFVTSVFPQDFSRNVYGIIQRTRMFLDAIKSIDADMEIMFLTPNGVPIGGGTASNIAKQLAEHWGIHCKVVLCERDIRPKENLKQFVTTCARSALGLCRHPNFYPFTGSRQKDVFSRCLSRSPDIVFFQRIYATGPSLSFPLTGTRVFLDLDDVEHLRFAREIRQPPFWRSKILNYFQVPALWRDERAAIVRSNSSFVCSRVDKRYLRKIMRVRNVEVIPNSVPQVADGPLSVEPNVLFIGNGLFGPNKVAVDYLIEKVWPKLTKKCSNARILIAGPGWDEMPVYKNPPNGIEFLGFVDDLNVLYRKTRVLCCPIQSGGGTRIKILEAANYGVPVVSTKIGAEGIDFKNDEEILIRDDSYSMADACADFLIDDELAQRISAAAKERVRLLYSRNAIIKKIKTILTGDSKTLAKKI